ncbi:chromosome partitioning protein ParB [Prevotella sp. OH937_COT-195]|uniref:chromosome partitioning protein ParB n=1 Tax=Prevotella sp. OH937_COT-195 TaxID=2491051 RepID=UPI000F646312|nr:chromosome partitioning protein ParB [Prevotella sp. OH937_COT-195]RRC99067.1 chromosome partitioning protein ParB [Prevotella sp. OH937_COT-195]
MKQLDLFSEDFESIPNPIGAKKRKIIFSDYERFVEKFQTKKTTDDCYTPPDVYKVIEDYVRREFNLIDAEFVRPFYPGGDYKNCLYPQNCVVVDNPPFSIYSEIVRWYISQGIRFFLFGPHLTLFVKKADVTYIVADAQITYENGAKVKTSFVTNLPSNYRIILAPELRRSIDDLNKLYSRKKITYDYPANVASSALLGKLLSRGAEFRVKKDECVMISNLDCLRRAGRSLFGGGILFSNRKAMERVAKERVAKEKKEMAGFEEEKIKIVLSEREMKIIKELEKNDRRRENQGEAD